MKKIITFSLWGNIPCYTVGAIKNALLAKKYFPEWICRYYYDNTVPNEIIEKLNSFDNTELIFIEKPSGATKWKLPGQFGMLWKFYAFNDDDVEIWLSRDTDSRISPYEKKYIDEFINSDKIIHSFRDLKDPLLRGGMTSFKNYSKVENNYKDNRIINGEKLDIKEMMNYIIQDNTPFYTDENFLKDKLLPIYKNYYSYNLRNDNSISFPNECGPYVGSVVDENDNYYNKNNNTILVNNKWIKKL
tara:strand:- start:2809 stop:3543 length:735 start_codon:yes stop_codon:yes gene_type:complete